MIKVRSDCSSGIVRDIMASVFEKNKALFILWFTKFQFLMFAIPVKRKYKSEYDKKTSKFAANIIGGVKRKDRCCSCCCGPAKSLPSMDGKGILGKRL